MPRPERGTPEYDAYKAAKRAKEARESRSANLLTIDSSHSRHRSRSRHSGYGTSDEDDEGRRIRTHSPAPDSEDRSRRRRRAESGGNLLAVEDHHGSRHRSLSRHSGYGSEDSCDEGRRIRTHSPAPDSESVATEDRARRRRRGDSSGNLLTVDDPRDRRSSRHRSVSRHSGYGDSEDEEGGRRIRTHSRDPAYGEDKSRRRPERERSRVRFEEEDKRRSRRSPERESYRDQSPAPPVFVERVETLKGESSAGSSARRKGRDGERSKDPGVYNAPEPPISYQPPAYVDTAAAIGALGVLPGKKPSKHGHSQSMGYSGSGGFDEDLAYDSHSSQKNKKDKKKRYSEADLAYGDYSDNSATYSASEANTKPYRRPLKPEEHGYLHGSAPSSAAASKPSRTSESVGYSAPHPPPKVPIESPSNPGSYASGGAQKSEQAPPSSNPFLYQTGGPVLPSSQPSITSSTNPRTPGYNPQPVPQVNTGGSLSTSTAAAYAPVPAPIPMSAPVSMSAPIPMPSPAPVIPPPPITTYGHSKTSSLTVPGALNLSGPGSAPLPMPSPALQPYHGTYQSISPMPSPIFNASPNASITNLPAFSLGPPAYPPATIPLPEDFVSPDVVYAAPSSPSISGFAVRPASPPYLPQSSPPSSPEHRPRRSSYNPAPDAKAILSELKSTFSRPSPRPLINILPTLSPSDLSLLRQEYKHLFRGVNLAKHIKSVFPTTTPFGKLAFSLALGPYESEAWFANSWYQKRETRNELLIEALMGKTNEEIGKIKAAFKDAKYESSLEKAVAAELPRDKFRYAVMVQLGCVRMEEEVEVSVDGVREDVARLGNILERRQSGGETEMIEIIVNRSNRWLQAVVDKYRLVYNRDLQKSIRERSRNLVGETLLHILAGATNTPLRDAKLLDQAITAAIEDRREDLLISRATRVHWDMAHLKRVKNAFRRKYGVELGERIRAATRGAYQEMLCRMVREER